MLDVTSILLLVVALLGALVVFLGGSHLLASPWTRRALLAGGALVPLFASAAALRSGVEESSQTRFCLSCHEMQDYGRSLFVDERRSLPAVHFQNRLVDRDTSCYSCHKDYALFGDVKAKVNGLRHVWVHYAGKVPERMALYEPYSNGNCLHCHADARRYVEAEPHKAVAADLEAGALSCLKCHSVGHDMQAVHAQRFWGGE